MINTLEISKLDAPELKNIEPSKAETIRSTFEPMSKMLFQFEEKYNEIIDLSKNGITSELASKAKRLRLDIGKVRVETDKLRKKEKEEYLRAGKAIDGVANILKWAVADKEGKLKEIENYIENLEKQRLEDLQEMRVLTLSQFVEDAHERNLSSMDDDVWSAYLSAKKKEHEDRIEAEQKAEADRIQREKDEAVERERVRKENIRLKAEAEAKAKQDAIDKAKRETIAKKEAEAKAKIEAKLKAEQDKAAAAKLKADAKAAKLQKEIADQKAADEKRIKDEAEAKAKAEADAEAARQAELKKGDGAKVHDLINDLSALKTKYSFKSAKYKKTYAQVNELIDKVINHIKK